MPSPEDSAPSARSGRAADRARVDCFSVVAMAAPGTLPRILETFAQRGLVPARLHAAGDERGEVAVDLQVAGLDADAAALVAAKLRALVDVRAVLTYQKRA